MSSFNEELQQFKAMIDSTDLGSVMPRELADIFAKLSKQIEDGVDRDTITNTLVECLTAAKGSAPSVLSRSFGDAIADSIGLEEKAHSELRDAIQKQQTIRNMPLNDQLLAFAVPLSVLMAIRDQSHRDEFHRRVQDMMRRSNESKSYHNKRRAEAMDQCLKECSEAIERCWQGMDAAEKESGKSSE